MLSEKLMEVLESIQSSMQLNRNEKLAYAYAWDRDDDCSCQGYNDYCSGGCIGDPSY